MNITPDQARDYLVRICNPWRGAVTRYHTFRACECGCGESVTSWPCWKQLMEALSPVERRVWESRREVRDLLERTGADLTPCRCGRALRPSGDGDGMCRLCIFDRWSAAEAEWAIEKAVGQRGERDE